MRIRDAQAASRLENMRCPHPQQDNLLKKHMLWPASEVLATKCERVSLDPRHSHGGEVRRLVAEASVYGPGTREADVGRLLELADWPA